MRIALRHLAFTSPAHTTAEIEFSDGLNLLYGSSNTGKSFAVKAIDYLLGGARALPDIAERRPYDRAWLGLDMHSENITLSRALAGGSFMLDRGLVTSATNATQRTVLKARHDAGRDGNVSKLLLSHLALEDLHIAVDANGKKNPLSFRDVVRFCIVDETAIQADRSPVESGEYTTRTKERSAFKLLLTGIDDSAIAEIVDERTFKSINSAQLEMLNDMIKAIENEVNSEFANSEILTEQAAQLDNSLTIAQANFEKVRSSIGDLLAQQRELSRDFSAAISRVDDLNLNVGRFEQLDNVYKSDIDRLEALDEAGFLIALGGGRDCPLCGSDPKSQRYHDEIDEIEMARSAAEAEAAKIARQREDLRSTVDQIKIERERVKDHLPTLREYLAVIENELDLRTPSITDAQRAVQEIMEVRDKVKRGLMLSDQLRSLRERRDEIANRRPAAKTDKPHIGLDGPTGHEFAQTVSEILKAWHFPGPCHVSFDEKQYDIRIDGKLRTDNGKGVRAITHAAFKIAILLFCRRRSLPHPGFIVLDSPLLTYRAPLSGEKRAYEDNEIASSNLKRYFFDHLSSISEQGQFIVIENVDPPIELAAKAKIQIFNGFGGVGRAGLF